MRQSTMPLLTALVLMSLAIPSSAWASHATTDDRSTTSLEDFRAAVDPWVDPWIEISGTSIADDHAPWLAISLYDVLLGIRPEPCYVDTYAAYWAVAADLRALGRGLAPDQYGAAMAQVLGDLDRAGELAAHDAGDCGPAGRGTQDAAAGATNAATGPGADQAPAESSSRGRVIEIEATAALHFTDERGNPLDSIEVTPGETIIFRVHNSAGFEHSFYIGTASQLMEPGGTTDIGIPAWTSGERDLEWTVPDETSDLLFACTVPGHFPSMHGTFTVAPPQ